MKKAFLTLVATMVLASTVLAQGTVNLNNLYAGGPIYDSDGTTLYNGEFTVALYGGDSAASLALLATYTTPAGFNGVFFSATDYAVPGVPATAVGTFELLGFAGPTAYSTVAAAQAALVKAGSSGIWTQVTGGAIGTDLKNPAVTLTLTPVPEPTTLAFSGMSVAAMWIARRRK